MFNDTFNYILAISLRSVLLVEEPGVPGENHRTAASHWKTLSHNIVHLAWAGFELKTLVVIGNDCTCSCKLNYLTIMTTTAHTKSWFDVSDVTVVTWGVISVWCCINMKYGNGNKINLLDILFETFVMLTDGLFTITIYPPLLDLISSRCVHIREENHLLMNIIYWCRWLCIQDLCSRVFRIKQPQKHCWIFNFCHSFTHILQISSFVLY